MGDAPAAATRPRRLARPSPLVDRTRPAATPVPDGWPPPRDLPGDRSRLTGRLPLHHPSDLGERFAAARRGHNGGHMDSLRHRLAGPPGRGPRRPPRGSGPRSPATGASRCPASPRRSCAQAGLHHLDVLAVADEQARVVVAQVVEGHAGAEAGRRRGGAPDGGEPGPAHRWPGRRGEHQRGWLARPGEGTPPVPPSPTRPFGRAQAAPPRWPAFPGWKDPNVRPR